MSRAKGFIPLINRSRFSSTYLGKGITDLITAWIAKDDDAFKTMFYLTMKETEVYIPCLISAKKEHPSKKRQLRKLASLYGHAISAGGDMTPELAETLLDDLFTDGKQLHSSKIQQFGTSLLSFIHLHSHSITNLNCWYCE